MRILFVTPPPYLPNRYHRMRSFDFIKTVSLKHEVHLLCITTQKKEPEEFKEIRDVCKSVTVLYISPIIAAINCIRFFNLPLEVAFCYSKKASHLLKQLIKKNRIEILYLKRLRSAIYIEEPNIPVLLDTTDAMSLFYFRLSDQASFPKKIFYLFEAIKYRVFEKNTINKSSTFPHGVVNLRGKNNSNNPRSKLQGSQKVLDKRFFWITCSEIDKKYLETLSFQVYVTVIPNPVDIDYFSSKGNNKQKKWLLLRGLMDKPVNIDAARYFVISIFPLIQKEIRNAKLFIVGPNPHASVKSLSDGKNIIVTGKVTDVREYIEGTSISVCPVRIGTGTRFKILQSWAMQRPVVSTSAGAEGLQFNKDKHIKIADTEKDFAQNVISLMKNTRSYNLLAKNGYDQARKFYSLAVIEKKLHSLLTYAKKSST